MNRRKNLFASYVVCLLLFLYAIKSAAQDSSTAGDSTTTSSFHKKVIFKEYVNLYYFKPVPVGNNVLAKANKSVYGFGVSVSLFALSNFYLRAGYEHSEYSVTDVSLASTASRTFLNKISPELMYKFELNDDFSLNPMFGIGYIKIKQKTGKRNFGSQEGTAVTFGLNADYRVSGTFKVFTGLHYDMYRPGVTVTPEYRDFYHKLNAVAIVLGIKL